MAGDNYGAARDREEEGGEKARLGMVTLEEPLKPDKLCYNLTVGIGPRTSSVGTCCMACCWGLTVFLRLLLQYRYSSTVSHGVVTNIRRGRTGIGSRYFFRYPTLTNSIFCCPCSSPPDIRHDPMRDCIRLIHFTSRKHLRVHPELFVLALQSQKL